MVLTRQEEVEEGEAEEEEGGEHHLGLAVPVSEDSTSSWAWSIAETVPAVVVEMLLTKLRACTLACPGCSRQQRYIPCLAALRMNKMSSVILLHSGRWRACPFVSCSCC